MKINTSNLNAAVVGHANAMGVLANIPLICDEWGKPKTVNNLRHIADVHNNSLVPTSGVSVPNYENYLSQFKVLVAMLRAKEIDYISISAGAETFLPSDAFYTTGAGWNSGHRTNVLILTQETGTNILSVFWGSSEHRLVYGGHMPWHVSSATKGSIADIIRSIITSGELYLEDETDITISDNLSIPRFVSIKGAVVKGGEFIEYVINDKPIEEISEKSFTSDSKLSTVDSVTTINPNKEKENMSKSQSIVSTLLAANKAAAVNAGEMEAGRLINQRIASVFGGKVKLPFGAGSMVNTPVGHVVLANLFATLIREYAPDNELAARAADGAVKSAAYELLRGVDIPAMLDEVLAGVTIKKTDGLGKIEL